MNWCEFTSFFKTTSTELALNPNPIPGYRYPDISPNFPNLPFRASIEPELMSVIVKPPVPSEDVTLPNS